MMQGGPFKYAPEFSVPCGPTPEIPADMDWRIVLSVRLEPIPGDEQGFDDSGQFLGIWSGEDDLVAAAIRSLKDKRSNARRVGMGQAAIKPDRHDLNFIHESDSCSVGETSNMAERAAAGNAGCAPEGPAQ
jgi:hypothetical protein